MTATEVLNRSVVVFSQNYLPLMRITLRRAVTLILTGKAEPILLYNPAVWAVRSPSVSLQIPAHIRLIIPHRERGWKVPPVSRREVLKRDRSTCQYCGSRHHLTLDHVLPRSKGGQHTWNNVVTACATCNGRKGDRTPEQAKMLLRTIPKAPIHPTVIFAEQFWDSVQDRPTG
ncbi:HNH endonuclease [Spirulina major]|uniref:HNH endonuclease n=1 Tax=Spirulina major TaxID=270636 RepID=UPI000932EFAD|nr:HNH endonuclease [Spirulina major]